MDNKMTTYDVYNNKYFVNKDELDLSVHLYGIALKDNKILISPQYNGFDFPGGTVKKGETHIETLIREVKEETGYLVEPKDIAKIYTSFFHHNKRNKDYQSYLIFYFVDIVDGNISTEGFDDDEKEYAKMAKWVDLDYIKNNKHACSLDIKDELIDIISARLNSEE